ncbi:MAG: hypothetical protein EA001_14800 [Oscillatoriales cyanobacterium]|nr:MAG: hypothetical protein EA001_14800 [Oscillatoriales cyanobacterium]
MGLGQKQNSLILADRPGGSGWAIGSLPPDAALDPARSSLHDHFNIHSASLAQEASPAQGIVKSSQILK